MTSLVFSLSFIVVALATSCFTLPIIETETSTSFPVNLVDGHLPRAFTNQFDMFTSTLTPSFEATTAIPHRMSKKDDGADDQEDKQGLEMTTIQNDGQVEHDERSFEENKDLDMTTIQNDGQVEHDERSFEDKKDLEMTTVEPEEDVEHKHSKRSIDDKKDLEMTTIQMEEHADHDRNQRSFDKKNDWELTTMKNEGQVQHGERLFDEKKDLEMTTIQNEGQVEHGERSFEEKEDLEMTTMKSEGQIEHGERIFDEKKDLELTTMGIKGQFGNEQIDLKTRKFEETNTLEPEVLPAGKLSVKVQTTVEKVPDQTEEKDDKSTSSTMIPQSFSSSTKPSTKASEKFVGHYEDEEEKEKEKEKDMDMDMEKPKSPKKPIKESKNKKDEKEEDEDESEEKKPKRPSAPLAEFVPNVLDSISTPPGNRLQFDENQQSIPHLSTEKSKEKEIEVDEDSNEKTTPKIVKGKKTIMNKVPKKPTPEDKLNQGEEPSIPEEKESNH